jgi:hypothetical protein
MTLFLCCYLIVINIIIYCTKIERDGETLERPSSAVDCSKLIMMMMMMILYMLLCVIY